MSGKGVYILLFCAGTGSNVCYMEEMRTLTRWKAMRVGCVSIWSGGAFGMTLRLMTSVMEFDQEIDMWAL